MQMKDIIDVFYDFLEDCGGRYDDFDKALENFIEGYDKENQITAKLDAKEYRTQLELAWVVYKKKEEKHFSNKVE